MYNLLTSQENNNEMPKKRKLIEVSIPKFVQRRKTTLIKKQLKKQKYTSLTQNDIVYIIEQKNRYVYNGKVFILLCANDLCMNHSAFYKNDDEDRVLTSYCRSCAEFEDPLWSKSQKHRKICIYDKCTHFKKFRGYCYKHADIEVHDLYANYIQHTYCEVAECKYRKESSTYEFRSTKFCISHAKLYDKEWYSNYRKKNNCAISTCFNLLSTSKFNNIGTIYCQTCAKTYDKTWYEAWRLYHKCKICKNCSSGLYYLIDEEERQTEYCIECSKLHDSKWYQAHHENLKCQITECTSLRKSGYYEGLSTIYYIDHSKICNKEYIEARNRVKQCDVIGCSYKYKKSRNDYTTIFCIRHTKMLDPDWFQRLRLGKICKTCPKFAIINYDYCGICLSHENVQHWLQFKDKKKCATDVCFNTKSPHIYEETSTFYCVKCSQTFNLFWYQMYLNNLVCNNINCSKLRCFEIYNGIFTKYCKHCSRNFNSEWHELHIGNLQCIFCENQRCSHTLRSGYSTPFCIICVKTHDVSWYNEYNVQKCKTQDCLKSRETRKCNNIITEFCRKCSRTNSPFWFEGFKKTHGCQEKDCDKFGIGNTIFCTKHTIGYVNHKHGCSKAGCQFIDFYEKEMNVQVQHVDLSQDGSVDGKEHKIQGVGHLGTKVDGWIESLKTVIEFHGSYWHGDPNVYESDDIHPIKKITYGEVYDKTMLRMQQLKDLGYNVIYVWELDFRNWLKQTNRTELKTIIKIV